MKKVNSKLKVMLLVGAACLLYGVNGGLRSSYGIMLKALSSHSGMAYADISFVVAVGQLIFGLMQPFFGFLALKKSNRFVLLVGILLMLTGIMLIPFAKSFLLLLMALGIILPSGTGALSFGLIFGIISSQVPPSSSGMLVASNGIFATIIAPVVTLLFARIGMVGAMSSLGLLVAFLFPVALWLCKEGDEGRKEKDKEKIEDKEIKKEREAEAKAENSLDKNKTPLTAKELLLQAFANKNYIYLLIGFFTCGFHMSIISTHLFTQITTYGISNQTAAFGFSLYGLASMVGAVLSGILSSKYPFGRVLGCLYGSRSLMILLFLFTPHTVAAVYLFAICLGLTGGATVPPTSGMVIHLFGAPKLATLFGFVFFIHQVGGFFSAWLGGICVALTGGYTEIWLASVVLSAIASAASFRLVKDKS